VFEYKITGMTCVNCVAAINKKVNESFKDRGLIDIKTTLITHKSRVAF